MATLEAIAYALGVLEGPEIEKYLLDTYRRIADVVESKIGTLAGNAMARKKDDDYTTLFATFGTGASPGARTIRPDGKREPIIFMKPSLFR